MIQNPKTVDDDQPRWEAYRLAAELLVGFRRIVHRGVVKIHGADWVASGCPAAIRDRLARREQMEFDVERSSAMGEDLIHHTTFADLAELVEADDALAEMLSGLSSSPDGLGANLRTLEDVRRKVAAARHLSDSESVVLAELHLRLREKLAGAKRRARTQQAEPGMVAQAAIAPRRDDGAAESDPPGGLPAPAGDPNMAQPTDSTTTVVTPPVLDESAPTQAADRRIRAVKARNREVFDGASTPVGLVHVAEDDLQILRDLRLEIIAAAEAAYSYSDVVDASVWARVWDSGWFRDKVEAYGLGEVSTFYALMEGYLERQRRGDNRESLRTFLADRELAKLLLRLRELFIRLRV